MKEVTVPEKPTVGISLYCDNEALLHIHTILQLMDRTYIRFIFVQP